MQVKRRVLVDAKVGQCLVAVALGEGRQFAEFVPQLLPAQIAEGLDDMRLGFF